MVKNMEVNRPYSPHLNIITTSSSYKYVKDYKKKCKHKPLFLDIGGRNGGARKLAKGYKHIVLEIDKKAKLRENIIAQMIYGDICYSPFNDGLFDIVFSNNVFEHIKYPWLAADECVRICKKGGLLFHIAPFSARYHPVPNDYFRYTHSGFKELFERQGNVKTVLTGYDIEKRRKNMIGGKLKNYLDAVPIDKMGGWRENWRCIYIGRKIK